MAGKIIADIIEAPYDSIRMNVANVTVLTANSSGLTYVPTGNVNVNIGTTASLTLGNVTVSNLITANGGIKFPATQVASGDANTLDDYEEGTWTPFIFGGTTAGTYTYEAARTGGRYVKVGRTVWFSAGVRVDTRPTPGSGSLNIGGLPFTGGGVFSAAGTAGFMTMCYSLSTVSGVHIVGRVNDSGTSIDCFDISDFNYGTNVPSIGTYDGVGFWLIFEGRYTTNS